MEGATILGFKYYIINKYREARKINKENFENNEKIFHLLDDNSKEISKAIEYEIKNDKEESLNL